MMGHKKEPESLGDLSSRQLRARRKRALSRLPDPQGYLAGSVVEQSRRCGKPGCRCGQGDLHGPYVYLSVGKATGRRSLVYVPEALAQLVRAKVLASEDTARLLAEISAINLELLARRELE
ncbi:MAG: DUF6788 family protein [Mycobacteriales bacterium]